MRMLREFLFISALGDLSDFDIHILQYYTHIHTYIYILMHINMHGFELCFSNKCLQKFLQVTQVPVIVPFFVRPMVPIWGPCPKLRPRVAPAMPNGSVPKWILNASQRHENLWPLGMKDKGKNAGKTH